MEAGLEEAPNPNLLYDLYTGVFRPQIVRLALLWRYAAVTVQERQLPLLAVA